MLLRGTLVTESPIYRGNARRILFTRDGDGTQRLVSLAGEIAGTAESLMDAFIGKSRDGRNIGLLPRLWSRLYHAPMPEKLITKVECRLQEESYPRDRFFDLRMGIKLDEDRWAVEANANYKMETLFRHTVFHFTMEVKDSLLHMEENASRLYYVLQELKEGRFWFGAGKSKGLGRCRLEMELPFSASTLPSAVRSTANHLTLFCTFTTVNPVLVGWNWGKVDPEVPAFAAIEGRLLVEAMQGLPDPIQKRLAMGIGGPILHPEDWKRKLAESLPKAMAAWLVEHSTREEEGWTLSAEAVAELGQGKYPLSAKVLARLQPLSGHLFPTVEAAEVALNEALGKKANMTKRVLKVLEHQKHVSQSFDNAAWLALATPLELENTWAEPLAAQIHNETALVETLAQACRTVLPRLYQQVDRQIKLLQSDSWIDSEIATREEHLRIKRMLLAGEIEERQWGDPDLVPEGIRAVTWQEFLAAHHHVQFRHMLHEKNLRKSMTNDQHLIAFLKAYRDRTRQELAQPYHIDFRAGGIANREISRQYGKPYDTVFMRMLSWAVSTSGQEGWEIYIPGSTIKGAFRRRASQILKTLWGESARTTEVLNALFGMQGQRGLVFFSDAYLADPQVPERSWCSMDGVKMNPRTGQPIEEAKADYLFAYGDTLSFALRLDIQDIAAQSLEALSILRHLLQDFQKGDIPLGGEKTCGFGWVEAVLSKLQWKTTDPDGISTRLFGKQPLTQEGIWYRLNLEGEAAQNAWQSIAPLGLETPKPLSELPKAHQGFISHRAFGGYCGTLAIEAMVLTPLLIRESGEPSYQTTLGGEPVYGWDFFSLAPPKADLRDSRRNYALPSKSIKGMIRHLYTIASGSSRPSPDISHLNPTASLFGWVGNGPNQSLMGRVSFSFGLFTKPELAWFKIPYPYGTWQYTGNQWQNVPRSSAPLLLIGQNWRIFPHAPLAPCVERLSDFRPETAQADYGRAILPGAQCRFTVRFWNLEKEELQRLLWCLVLEKGLAHKMGKGRYLGFGSLRLRLLPESFLIDWTTRYASMPSQNGRLPLQVDEWINTTVIQYYAELQQALYAEHL